MSDPTAEDGPPGEGEAPPDPEHVAAATKIQKVVRGHAGRVRHRNEAEERRQERVRVPNSGWGFDELRSVMLNSVLVAPAPKIATDVDLVPIAPNVAETIVSSYEGERNADGEYHGQGIATFASGSKYQGLWAHGLMDGKGTFTWSNNISYSGQMVRGRICGRGTLRWPGGNVYDGEVLDGYRHGKGKFVMVMESDEVEDESAVITYDGMWHMGKRHGHGVLLYDSDGKAKYDGGWANDLRHGEGTMQYASGNFYQGGWARGLMHGHGKMLWHTRNEVYIGEWREGRPDGAGEHVWFAELQSGTPFQTLNRYSGEMARGLRHGQGRFEYADGSSYEGAWVEGAKHGEGTFVFPDGHRYAGAFAQDRMVDYKKPARVPGASGTQEVVLRIGDLLAQEADAEAHVLKVKNVLVQYMSELKQIFRYYSQAAKEEDAGKKTPLPLAANPNEQKARPGGANSLIRLSAAQRGLIDNSFAMSMLDFWKMARDCRLPDARLSLAAIDRVFLLVDQHSHDRADALAVHSPHRKLIFRAFLEGLVRLADGKYPELPTLAERLTYMLFHNLLPYACQDTADDFRQRLEALEVRHVLEHYEPPLLALYRAHAREGPVLRVRALVALLRGHGLIGGALGVADVVDMHHRASLAASVADSNAANLDTEVIPSEFAETLARIAERLAGAADGGDKTPALAALLEAFFARLLPAAPRPPPFSRARAQKKAALGALPRFPSSADRTPSGAGRTVSRE